MPEHLSSEDVARMRDQIGEIAIAAAAVDLDAFLEVVKRVGSPQTLTAGIDPRVVASAGDWTDLAGLLRPFRDAAVERIDQIRKEDAAS
jgi:hypothetical protein